MQVDGAIECFAAIDSIKASLFGSFFSFDELYEREYWWNDPRHRGTDARQLNRTNVLASLNAGRNIVYHMGTATATLGDRTGRLLTSDVSATTNGPRYSGLAYAVNCNSAAVDADWWARLGCSRPEVGSELPRLHQSRFSAHRAAVPKRHLP